MNIEYTGRAWKTYHYEFIIGKIFYRVTWDQQSIINESCYVINIYEYNTENYPNARTNHRKWQLRSEGFHTFDTVSMEHSRDYLEKFITDILPILKA